MFISFHNSLVVEAGIDEVGRGCLAGPVVAAAVILPRNYQNSYVKDSKKLKPVERVLLAQEIKKIAISYAIAQAEVEEINQYNILNATFLAMHRAIQKLTPQPEYLLIDGNRFKPYPSIPHTCIVRGDSLYLSIAAASILAKDYRDNLMKSLALHYPHYDWQNNVGYATPKHLLAIEKYGLTNYHRKYFRVKKPINFREKYIL
ncbi:MAG: ribonuclease HII [Microscillaceae bacterium]|nr:ribonuclease HII [Microscillaceae bacterium]